MSTDASFMEAALEKSRESRRIAPPNPWVGCILVDANGTVIATGATEAPGHRHAEVVAIEAAGGTARGATAYVTLEPCSHVGRTAACSDALIAAGVTRVVVAIEDPDSHVRGSGLTALRHAGITVELGVGAESVASELAPYLWHRRTGRPYVVAKVAATLDGVVAMADGASQWITSRGAREDAHELRADSQAILVGAGTVRSDDPRLTARTAAGTFEPLRVVLGTAPATAQVHPCLERHGDLGPILDELGERGVLQLLVEGGPRTLSVFAADNLVNKFVWYVAPAWAGSRETSGALSALGTATMASLRRGRVSDVRRVGDDVRIDVEV